MEENNSKLLINIKKNIDNVEIESLNNISEQLTVKANEQKEIIEDNYRRLIKDIIKILENIVDDSITKPTIMFEIFFLLELFLKLFLLTSGNYNLIEIGRYRHNLNMLMCDSEKLEPNYFDEIKGRLRRIKNKAGNGLNYDEFTHYKYNHMMGKEDLIFEYEMTDCDKTNVKEVMNWIKIRIAEL